jgi:CRISPR-associated protein Cmr4
MTVWNDVVLSAIYTISPVHCGIGQAVGAIDLPIARDTATGFPVLPATSLKGVARDFFEKDEAMKPMISRLFGNSLEEAENSDQRAAGALAFTEGRLILFPVRSLNRPFFCVTCPLILERLYRDMRALGMKDFFPHGWKTSKLKAGQAHVSDETLTGKTLVLEDLVYQGGEVGVLPDVTQLARRLADLLPPDEKNTRERITNHVVVIPDADFTELIMRATPVRARIKLTEGKTTDKWIDEETGEVQSGNLWYEEFLPSECLFISFVGERRQRILFSGEEETDNKKNLEKAMPLFLKNRHLIEVVQIGGNETVGHGICFWTLWPGDEEKGS